MTTPSAHRPDPIEQAVRLSTLDRQVDGHRWTLDGLSNAFMGLDPQAVIGVLHAHGSVLTANPLGVAPIVAAAAMRDDAQAQALIQALIGCGAPVNTVANDGTTALDLALRRPSLNLAQGLLEQGADPDGPTVNGQPDGARRSPLHTALMYGPDGAVALLLAHGASPDRPGPDQRNALDIAVRYGRFNDVMALLAAGADAARPCPQGGGLLHLAAALSGTGPDGCLWHHRPDPDGSPPSRSLSETFIHVLAAHGADPDARDHQERTPLHHAVNLNVSGSRNAQKRRHGPRTVPRDGLGLSQGFHDQGDAREWEAEVAVTQRRWNVQALLTAGASPNLVDRAGHSPLSRASQHRPLDPELLENLIEAGADWNQQAPGMPRSPREVLEQGLHPDLFERLERRFERISLERTMAQALDEAPSSDPRVRRRL